MLREPEALRLPVELLHLPRSAPAALYAPSLQDLLEDLQDGLELAGAAMPRLRGMQLSDLIDQGILGGGMASWSAGSSPSMWAPLASPEGLQQIGVDPQASVTVLFEPELGVAVFGFGLESRPKWERWLDQVAGGARTRITFDGEQASVLAPDSEAPVTCIARHRRAFCQVGAREGADPLGPLHDMTSGGQQTWADVPGLARAFGVLPPGARTYAVINPEAIARWLGAEAKAKEQRAHRFASPAVRRRAVAEAQAMGQKVRNYAAKIDGAAFGLYRSAEGLSVRMETAMSALGARLLAPHLRPYGEHSLLSRWANTPALMQVILRTHPRTTEWILKNLQLDLPASTLTGDLALMTLGVDTDCAMAKRGHDTPRPRLSWAFFLPSAAAVGLAGPRAADQVHELLGARFEAEAPVDSTPGHRSRIRGTLSGSPYELDVLDQILLVGAGHGSGPAALRRLQTLPTRPARSQPPLFEASLDLHAIEAALASGTFDGQQRQELMLLHAMRAGLQPLLEYVAHVDLSASAKDRGQRLSAELRTRR